MTVIENILHIYLYANNKTTFVQEQMADVLDAMFEKIVQPGEFIIRQGDDGDNFYVIER